MESLDELRKAIGKLQSEGDLLKRALSNLQNCRKLEVVGEDVAKLSSEARQGLEVQWRLLQGYLQDNFSGAQASSPPIDSLDLERGRDLLEEIAQSGDPHPSDLLALGVAAALDERSMKFILVTLPDVELLRRVERILNNRRDQQKWSDALQLEMTLLKELIKADPKGVSELIREVGMKLCDQLGDFIAPLDDVLEAVGLMLAKILGKILEWTTEVGGDIVQWAKDNAAEVEKFLAELGALVGELIPQIAGFIEQNGGSVVVVMAAVLVVVTNIRQKSRFRLEDLEIAEND